MATLFLSLGTNLGDRLQNLQDAIDVINIKIGEITSISPIYKTEAWGFDGGYFLNICIAINTCNTPKVILRKALAIEKELGRKRNISSTYSNRIIDIDILFIDKQIINTSTLRIPHTELHQRNFVLAPLQDIAKSFICPLTNKSIELLYKECKDIGEISKTHYLIKKPESLTEKYKHIVIEGNIGVGKTSLAKMLAKQYNTSIVLEEFNENPFLEKFYEKRKQFAFTTEMYFLMDRYEQITQNPNNENSVIISDYFILKSLIFAQITLSKEEYTLFQKIYDKLYKEIKKPDLYIYLNQTTNRLLENINKRGRTYEKSIKESYLEKINNTYLKFIEKEKTLNTKIIDVSSIDFVNNEEDYYSITKKILGD